MIQGFFTSQRVSELATYAEILDDDSVAPKLKLEEIIKYAEDEQRKIAMMNAQVKQAFQRANQFLMGDPEEQSSMMADAAMQLQSEQAMPEEAQYAEMEAELDEEVPADE